MVILSLIITIDRDCMSFVLWIIHKSSPDLLTFVLSSYNFVDLRDLCRTDKSFYLPQNSYGESFSVHILRVFIIFQLCHCSKSIGLLVKVQHRLLCFIFKLLKVDGLLLFHLLKILDLRLQVFELLKLKIQKLYLRFFRILYPPIIEARLPTHPIIQSANLSGCKKE